MGNDGVHQLQNFNRCLELLSNKSTTVMKKDTIIDGVMLTKFDTIDDKVCSLLIGCVWWFFLIL